ncbi:hypothetical protein [Streptomyces sp. CA-106110]|uniref:hypothetical protein n=1 Tax=Streptomyces sp. CA-106110 TaxID=3240044 RepID=UPI003D9264ED
MSELSGKALRDAIEERDRLLTQWTRKYPRAAKDVVAALRKVRFFRGDPDEYTCTMCEEQAVEWVLTDITEVEGPAVLPYSDDVNAYEPLCTPHAIPVCEERLGALNAWRFDSATY